jgi:WhiB family transcriptional regulator, redox-sensing transcriptional regulator
MGMVGARSSGYASRDLQQSYHVFNYILARALAAGTKPVCTSDFADPEWWFAEDKRLEARAKHYCFQCPLREECLIHAMAHEEYGIWGGLTRLERRTLKLRAERGWR